MSKRSPGVIKVIGSHDAMTQGLVLFLWLLLAGTSSAIPCSSCLQLSKSLEHTMLLQERTAHTTSEQQSRLGRSVAFRTEHDVDAALDAWCEGASAPAGVRHEALHTACTTILTTHRHAISNHLLDEGWRSVRSMLCVDVTHACQPHELYDSGEL